MSAKKELRLKAQPRTVMSGLEGNRPPVQKPTQCPSTIIDGLSGFLHFLDLARMDLRISIVRDPHENDLPVGPLKHFRIVPVPNLNVRISTKGS